MAFRERDPNSIGRRYARDTNWNDIGPKKGQTTSRLVPSFSKENTSLVPSSSKENTSLDQYPISNRCVGAPFSSKNAGSYKVTSESNVEVISNTRINYSDWRVGTISNLTYSRSKNENECQKDQNVKDFLIGSRGITQNDRGNSIAVLSPIKKEKRLDSLKANGNNGSSHGEANMTRSRNAVNPITILKNQTSSLKLDYSSVARKNLQNVYTPQIASIPSGMRTEKTVVNDATRITLEDYGRTLHRMGECAVTGGAERAEALLRDILQKFEEGSHPIRPDGACYNSVIHAYAKTGKADKAESILRLMFKDYQNGNEKAEPNVRVYTNVLHAWRKAKAPNAPERCEAILKEMYELSDTGILPACKPDTFSVTVLLHCWTESNREGSASRAESIFRKMKNRFLAGEQAQCPDCIAYSIVLNKFAQESMLDAAQDILYEMIDDFLSGNDTAEPRTRNFNTVLAMFSKSNDPDAPQRAEEVVARFRTLSKSGVINVHPDEYTYSLLLKTWVLSKRVDGIDKAVSCLTWMRELSKAGDICATPDIVKYTTIISAYSRSGRAEQAKDLLNTMIEDFLSGNELAKPDFKAFDIVITACTEVEGNGSRSSASCGNFMAESLIRQMWMLHESGSLYNLKPKASMYKSLIISYKKSMDPVKAEELLYEMDYYYSCGKLDEGPTKKLFQTVINSWHETPCTTQQKRLQKLRMDMNERFGRMYEN